MKFLVRENCINKMAGNFKFGQIEVASKDFYKIYQEISISDIGLDKIVIVDSVRRNKKDTRYTIGYEIEPQIIIPLYIMTPENRCSNGVTRYNDNSPWKMGFDKRLDKKWIEKYKGIWGKVEELLCHESKGTALSNEKYVNPKLIGWGDKVTTRFNGVLYPMVNAVMPQGCLKSVGCINRG